MRIKYKIILGFIVIASLFVIVEMVGIHIGQKIIQESIGDSSITLTTDAMHKFTRLRNIAMSITVLLTVMGILFSLFIFKCAWRPLSKLRAAMSKIADGDLDIRVDSHRNDEIGELTDAFNHMAQQLKKAEEALDVNQGQFNAILRSISDDIALIDKDLNIIWSNTTAQKTFGDDMIGKKCYDVYHQRTLPCEPYPCPTIKAFYDDQIHQYETMVQCKDGRIRYLHCVANVALRDEQGQPEAVLEICRDITERRKMEDALRASERKCSDLVQNSPDAIISLDKTGNFLSFNVAAERMTGFLAEEVLGEHFTKIGILAEESIHKTLKEFGLLLTGAERSPFELVIIRKDKSRLVMEANARLIERIDQETWVQLILRDITERKEAEHALDISENMLRTIINATQDAMIAVGEDGLINLYNPAAEKMFGRGRHEMIGQTLDLLIPEPYRQHHQQNVKGYFGTNKPNKVIGHTLEVPAQHRDGHVFPIELSLSVGTIDNKQVVISVARDITERKKAEQTLEELNTALETTNLELIRTNQELQEFAYIAAHDLKTPLRAIGTLADWLSVDYADKFDEQGKESVRLLTEKAKQMSSLIDDILRYSGAGQNTPKSQEVDLNRVISEVIKEIDPPEHIDVIIENPLPILIGKKTHIIQIFQNLIGNAVKYIDKPKGQIKVASVEKDNMWMFSIADNGPGIEKKYFDKIFKIFQTLSPREGVESTGIGLSIVKKLVELNKGSVWVVSEVGKGSTFLFTLPNTPIPSGSESEKERHETDRSTA
ncbi:PAS domain S-box protein [Planctomycetota bacterium]